MDEDEVYGAIEGAVAEHEENMHGQVTLPMMAVPHFNAELEAGESQYLDRECLVVGIAQENVPVGEDEDPQYVFIAIVSDGDSMFPRAVSSVVRSGLPHTRY